jgi:SAM-dependent methyltransferase
VTGYRPFDPNDAPGSSAIGWDAWAEEYAELPRTNAAYRFSKRLLYEVVDTEIGGRPSLDVLDFNCGCGNDFGHFLAAGQRIVGCDGSAGMLRVAAREHGDAVRAGAVSLFLGRAEHLSQESFAGRRFDLILSATGGTAYLDDERLRDVHRAFVSLLKPRGVMVVTHLLPRCLGESLWHFVHARPRAALQRWRKRISVTVKGEVMTMYLRSVADLTRQLAKVAPPERIVPLNVVTPPFQAGFRLSAGMEELMYGAERRLQRYRASLAVCDQAAWVARVSA